MIVTTIKGFTNVLGAPEGWDPAKDGECLGLPVKLEQSGDTLTLTSAWKPTPDEIAALQAGAPIHLRVVGGQSPVAIYVDGTSEHLEPDYSEADARRVLLLSRAVRLCQAQFEGYAASHAAKGTPDGDAKAEANRQIASICADVLSGAGPSDLGYIDAFYDLAKMMDIGARAASPSEVWASEMRPRIAAALECEAEVARMKAERDRPETRDFLRGVMLEAEHQYARRGAEHDAGKQPEDWLFLIGYLAGKACAAARSGNSDKALHHTISSAAALANWHLALIGADARMRPGIDPIERNVA